MRMTAGISGGAFGGGGIRRTNGAAKTHMMPVNTAKTSAEMRAQFFIRNNPIPVASPHTPPPANIARASLMPNRNSGGMTAPSGGRSITKNSSAQKASDKRPP